MHFEAKKVVVVGGSAGIGQQVAIDLVEHGGDRIARCMVLLPLPTESKLVDPADVVSAQSPVQVRRVAAGPDAAVWVIPFARNSSR